MWWKREKMQVREKGRDVAKHRVFQSFVAPEGRKVGSVKLRARSQLARWKMKDCTPLWCEAHLEVKMYKTPQLLTAFRSWDVKKSARQCGTCGRQKSKMPKCTKHTNHSWTTCGSWDVEKLHAIVARSTCWSENGLNTSFGPILEVEIWKKCALLLREANFESTC